MREAGHNPCRIKQKLKCVRGVAAERLVIMAYESKLFIALKNTEAPSMVENGLFYAQIIAEYKMCDFPAIRDFFHDGTNEKNATCYVYFYSNNVFTDNYGDPLKESSISDVVAFLEKLRGENKKYRRVAPLLAMLRAFKASEAAGEWSDGELVVLHYGY